MVNMRINRWISGHPLLGQSDAALGHDDNIMVVPTIWWLAPLNVGRSSPRLKCPRTSLWSTSASFMLIYNMPSVHCINIFGLYSLYRYVYIHIHLHIIHVHIHIHIHIHCTYTYMVAGSLTPTEIGSLTPPSCFQSSSSSSSWSSPLKGSYLSMPSGKPRNPKGIVPVYSLCEAKIYPEGVVPVYVLCEAKKP